MLVHFAAGGDGSSTGIPAAAGRASTDLSNGARFRAGDATAVVRVWSQPEWNAMPAASKPPVVGGTPDGRYVVALDFVEGAGRELPPIVRRDAVGP